MIIYDVILDLLVFYRIRVPLMPESSRMTKGYCIPHLVAFYLTHSFTIHSYYFQGVEKVYWERIG